MKVAVTLLAVLTVACSLVEPRYDENAALAAALSHYREQLPLLKDACVDNVIETWIPASRQNHIEDAQYSSDFQSLVSQADFDNTRVIGSADIAGFDVCGHDSKAFKLHANATESRTQAVISIGKAGFGWRNLWLEKQEGRWHVVAETKRTAFI